MEIYIEEQAAQEITKAFRGTPRIANRLLKKSRDYAQVRGDGNISLPITKESLLVFEVDEEGLDVVDKKILRSIIKSSPADL